MNDFIKMGRSYCSQISEAIEKHKAKILSEVGLNKDGRIVYKREPNHQGSLPSTAKLFTLLDSFLPTQKGDISYGMKLTDIHERFCERLSDPDKYINEHFERWPIQNDLIRGGQKFANYILNEFPFSDNTFLSLGRPNILINQCVESRFINSGGTHKEFHKGFISRPVRKLFDAIKIPLKDVTAQNLVVDFVQRTLQPHKINEEISESVFLPAKNEQLLQDPEDFYQNRLNIVFDKIIPEKDFLEGNRLVVIRHIHSYVTMGLVTEYLESYLHYKGIDFHFVFFVSDKIKEKIKKEHQDHFNSNNKTYFSLPNEESFIAHFSYSGYDNLDIDIVQNPRDDYLLNSEQKKHTFEENPRHHLFSDYIEKEMKKW